MNVFQAVKENVTARQAAEQYGFEVNHGGMMCCPFHDDKNPSMKVDKRFHCFGCGEDGDAIDFVGKLLSLKPKEAAEKLANDFGIAYDGQERYKPTKASIIKRIKREQEKSAVRRCGDVLSDYFSLLRQWRTDYAPKSPDDRLDPHFAESLEYMGYIDALCEEFDYATADEKAAFAHDNADMINNIERRMAAEKSSERSRCQTL